MSSRVSSNCATCKLCGSKRFGPGVHQSPLPDGGDGLELGQIGRALGQVQFAHAGADRAGADDRHLKSALTKLGHLRGDRADERAIQSFFRVR